MLPLDEISDIVDLTLDSHPVIVRPGVLCDLRGRPRLIKIWAEEASEFNDVKYDDGIHKNDQEEYRDLFSPRKANIRTFHAPNRREAKRGDPPSSCPDDVQPKSARTTCGNLL